MEAAVGVTGREGEQALQLKGPRQSEYRICPSPRFVLHERGNIQCPYTLVAGKLLLVQVGGNAWFTSGHLSAVNPAVNLSALASSVLCLTISLVAEPNWFKVQRLPVSRRAYSDLFPVVMCKVTSITLTPNLDAVLNFTLFISGLLSDSTSRDQSVHFCPNSALNSMQLLGNVCLVIVQGIFCWRS